MNAHRACVPYIFGVSVVVVVTLMVWVARRPTRGCASATGKLAPVLDDWCSAAVPDDKTALAGIANFYEAHTMQREASPAGTAGGEAAPADRDAGCARECAYAALCISSFLRTPVDAGFAGGAAGG